MKNRIDEAFEFMRFWHSKPDVVDLRLREMVMVDLLEGVEVAIAWLTATLPIKSKLPYRPTYYRATAERLTAMGKDAEHVLVGLK